MRNNTPILLDRLDAALKARGVDLKRSDLLGVATEAFGHRSANAFSAAVKARDVAPARLERLGVDDHGLAVLRNADDGEVFAIDAARDERGDRWRISPRGGLVDLDGLEHVATRRGVEVRIAVVTHRHGVSSFVATTADELEERLRVFCDGFWEEARERDADLPVDTGDMTDAQVVERYFDAMSDENLDRGAATLDAPSAILRSIETPSADAWAIARVNLEDDDPVLWWNDDDGWGDLASASVYADTTGRLPELGMGDASVNWERLPSALVTGSKTRDEVDEDAWMEAGDHARHVAAFEADPVTTPHGLTFDRMVAQRRWDGIGNRLLVLGRGSQEAFEAWRTSLHENVAKTLAPAFSDGTITLVLDGDGDVGAASDPRCWRNAVADLVSPTGPRAVARFSNQAWLFDNAIEVDPDGEREFDVTYEMLLMGEDAVREMRETDDLQTALRAPRWIRNWSGPFDVRVYVEQMIEDGLFGERTE